MIHRVIWFAIAAAGLAFSASVACAAPPAVDPAIGKVEVTLDLPKDKPYVGEMIILRMRSFVRASIVLDEIRQPPMINFDVQQLGRDKPIQAMVDGYSVAGVERDLAIFPQQSGRLIIDPFVRHVTIVNSDNQRVEADFASKPIYVDVQNYAAINKGDAWWLPAKSLTLTDTWAPAPDEIQPGTLARRTIVVEAVGLTGDRLPPAPDMLAPGTIAFKGPAERETIITEDGPVARATYRWDLRPVSSSPAKMPAITIPWFDTSERRMRDASAQSLWVAYIGTLVHSSHEKVKRVADSYLSAVPIVSGLVGFAWTAALVGFFATSRQRLSGQRLRRARMLSALKRAARLDDEPAFVNALADLARLDPSRWRHLASDPLVAGRLAALERSRYARDGAERPPLRALAADIRGLWRGAEDIVGPSRPSALPPLDGALPLGDGRTGHA
jgi:hypothetical protein